MFEDYVDVDLLNQLITNGVCWASHLRVVGSGSTAFVTFPNEDREIYTPAGELVTKHEREMDILISNKEYMNRAFPNDEVYIELLPKHCWEVRKFGVESAMAIKVKDHDETLQPRAKVIYMDNKARSYNTTYICMMRPNRNSKRDTQDDLLGDNEPFVRMVCLDKSVPWMLCRVKDLKYIKNNKLELDKLYEVKRLVQRSEHKLSMCSIVSCIGNVDDFSNVVLALTKQYSLEALVKDTDTNVADAGLETKTNNFPIPEDSLNGRLDFRSSRFIFTIDPETARDLDDAVHIRKLTAKEISHFNSNKPSNAVNDPLVEHYDVNQDPSEVYELGVHIADVSHYIQQGSIIDLDGRNRTTSVYMPHTVYPMLPRALSNSLCSLHPGEDKLTMSIIFHLETTTGALLLEPNGYPVHINRGVIQSRARLSYEEAQCVIDGLRGGSFSSIRSKYSNHGSLCQHREFYKSLNDPRSINWCTTWKHNQLITLLIGLDIARVHDVDSETDLLLDTSHHIARGATYTELNRTKGNTDLAKYLELGRKYLEHVNQPNLPKALQMYKDECDHRWEYLISSTSKDQENFLIDVYTLDLLMQRVRKRRVINGAGAFSNDKIAFIWRGYPVKVVAGTHSSSHECIEEMMLMANKLVCRFSVQSKMGKELAVLRIHNKPKQDKIDEINAFLRHINKDNMLQLNNSAKDMVDQLELASSVGGQNLEQALNGWLITCLDRARYVPLFLNDNIEELEQLDIDKKTDLEETIVDEEYVAQSLSMGQYRHWALNFLVYTHFTSPIRRYADILVHRCLSYILAVEGGETYWQQSVVPRIGTWRVPYGPHTNALDGMIEQKKIAKISLAPTLELANEYRLKVERSMEKLNDYLIAHIVTRQLERNPPVALFVSAISVYPMDKSVKIYIPALAMLTNIEFCTDYNAVKQLTEPHIFKKLSNMLPEFKSAKNFPQFVKKNADRAELSLYVNNESVLIKSCSLLQLVIIPVMRQMKSLFVPVSRQTKKKLVSLLELDLEKK